MKPELRQKIRNAFGDYSDCLWSEELEQTMRGYLGALFDLGLITEEEFWTALDNLMDACEAEA